MTTAKQILLAAADRISQPNGWMTANYAAGLTDDINVDAAYWEMDKRGRMSPGEYCFQKAARIIREGNFNCFCAVGAIMAEAETPKLLDEACVLLAITIRPPHRDSAGRPTSPSPDPMVARKLVYAWNDDEATTITTVADAMRKAAQ